MPLDGGETTLTTIEIPGHGVVSLPPVCLPYSPEFKPGQNDRGLVTLERLGRATAGIERIELKTIWSDLPRHSRMMSISRWLLLAAVVLWLVEILERRTSLISTLRRGRRRAVAAPEPAEKARAIPAAAAKAAIKPVPAAAPAPTAPAPARKPEPTSTPRPAAVAQVPVAITMEGGMSEALRKARQRAKGRTE